MPREYHALRVNLFPSDVDKLESNHQNLTKYIATLKDQLSEGRMAVATATVEGHGEPAHPSVSGTVTGYVKGVLETVKNDTSLHQVEHPWTKRAPRGKYAIAQAAAEAEAEALANIANVRKGGSKTAPKESRRKRRRRQNRQDQQRQADLLNSHDTSDGLPKTDLQQTFRDVSRNRSMLQDGMKNNKPRKKSYSQPLVRPSTAPPPKTPFGALKLLQHVLVYNMYEYKNALPREIGPGHYDLSAALPPTIKEPNRQSASFLSPHGHHVATPIREEEEEEETGGGAENTTSKVPTTFSGRQKMIAKILKEQGIGGADSDENNKKLSPYDRMTRGLRPKLTSRRHGGLRSHPLSGSKSASAPNLFPPPPIGQSLWDDAFYNVPAHNPDSGTGTSSSTTKQDNADHTSNANRRRATMSPNGTTGQPLPFDQQDLFYRPSSPIFRFPSAKRFTETTEPHWKGLGSPFNMKKDLSKWLQQKVYIDNALPRDGGASTYLDKREEGPRNLDQSFNSMVKNLTKSPITYKSSFDETLPRFQQGKKLDPSAEIIATGDSDKRWEAYRGRLGDDPTRPSLSFVEAGHPEDMSVIITMGSQFDKQKPRFLPSTLLRKECQALVDNNTAEVGGKKKTKKSGMTPIKKRTTRLSSMSPTTNRASPSSTNKQRSSGRKNLRPSTTVVQGSGSLGQLAQTV